VFVDELFADKYLLKKRLGLGGMAEVWLAELRGPQGFSRELVIKRILPHLTDDENFIEMFEDEARTAGRLNHPHAVRVDEFGQADGSWYLAMEYLDGADLRELVRAAHALGEDVPLDVILQIGGDIAHALQHAHDLKDDKGRALNLIHRDVSPHNVLVTRSGMAKLVDFGIARAESNQVKTRTGMVKGKSGYMSPEQALGRTLDGRSDMFALAVVLYEMALQARLFQGETDLAVMRMVVACDIPALREVDPEQPRDLSEILERALERNPDDRYSDCAAFADALFGALHTHGLRGGHQVVSRWVQRMLDAEVSGKKLPSVKERAGFSSLREEVTAISPSRTRLEQAKARTDSRLLAGSGLSAETVRGTPLEPSNTGTWLFLGLSIVVAAVALVVLWPNPGMDTPSDTLPNYRSNQQQPATAPKPPIDPVIVPSGRPIDLMKRAPQQKQPRPAQQPLPKTNRRPAPSTKATAPAAKTASLRIKILFRNRPQDWGLVYVDGRPIPGKNPNVKVRPGKHKVCVFNRQFNIAWKHTVDVPATGSTVIPVDMSKTNAGKCP
jgi:eukaryotic-like serine/threonine-protein kinase